ncbi:MAG: hypothetical protein RBR02_08035 [Desulfuromonadaceae bacterium]|nr:hypothetical protein [Desulfuromonadaceae bacterium]
MNIFERLQSAVNSAQEERELPDFIARDIETILQQRADFSARAAELEQLIEMLSNYDTYGQTGYLGMGIDSVILQGAVGRLLEQRREQ